MRFRIPLVIAAALAMAFAGAARADDASDLKAKLEALQKQMDSIKAQMDQMQKQREEEMKKPAAPPVARAEEGAAKSPVEALFDKLTKGFYGTIDVSGDFATKGMNKMTAGAGIGWVQTGPFGAVGQGHYTPPTGVKMANCNIPSGVCTPYPVGNVGWQPEFSTNKSGIGYRGSHTLPWKEFAFIYQIEANFSVTSAPGVTTSYTAQSNTTKSALGFGNTFVGFSSKDWGSVKVGTTYAPYKTSTDRLNPFSGMPGDYAVVMGNTGGDNRVEFGTRLEHAIWYDSPKMFGGLFSFDFLVSPGQNRTYDAVVQSSGSPDCSGGNIPGSGNLPANCDDGGYTSAWSVDVKFEPTKNIYLTAAYERHNDVNRNSDGIGSNNPIYGFYFGAASATFPAQPPLALNPLYLDMTPITLAVPSGGFTQPCGTGQCLTTLPLGAYTTSIGAESAAKIGAQYIFDFGLSLGGIWENLHRDVPRYLEFQNERNRNGYWLTATQDIGQTISISGGYAHATKSTGDPGGQHNYNPFYPDNTADMYTVAFKQKIDKQMFWYLDWAVTVNHGNAHYDLGAGGRGITTDCHDGTHPPIIDYSSFGPTTWGGCHPQAVSLGVDYKF
jgi:predicted porin